MAEKRRTGFLDSPLVVKRPTAQTVSRHLAILIAMVTLLMSIANYFYSIHHRHHRAHASRG